MLKQRITILTVMMAAFVQRNVLGWDFDKWSPRCQKYLYEMNLCGIWEGSTDLKGEKTTWEKTYLPGSLEKARTMWFRRKFELPKEWENKRVKLILGPARNEVEVSLNGKKVARKVVAWAPQEFYLTNFLNRGENEIVLEVNKGVKVGEKLYDVTGYGGEGVYGEVKLAAYEDIDIKDISIKPSVRDGKLSVEVTLKNEGEHNKKINLKAEVIDPNLPESRVVKKFKENLIELKGGEEKVLVFSEPWDGARYWNPANPYLYCFSVKVIIAGRECNGMLERFGFREFWVENGHFYLNGKRIRLRGDTYQIPRMMHNPYWIRKNLAILNKLGCNSFRLWPSIGSEIAYMAGDEVGMLWDACIGTMYPYLVGEIGITEESKIRTKEMIIYGWDIEGMEEIYNDIATRFIKAYRDHPSIISWDLNNEYVIVKSGGRYEKRMPGMKKIVSLFKKVDPTRILTTDGDPASDALSEISVENIHDYSDWYRFWPITLFSRMGKENILGGCRERFYYGKKPCVIGEYGGYSRGAQLTALNIIYNGEDAVRVLRSENNYGGLMKKRLHESWRIYDVDGMHACSQYEWGFRFSLPSIFPPHVHKGVEHYWVFENSPYLRIEHSNIAEQRAVNISYLDLQEYHLNAYGKGFFGGFKPLMATCANQWDWAYFAEEEVERKIYILNDSLDMRDLIGSVEWRLNDSEGNVVLKGDENAKVCSGNNQELQVKFKLPQVSKREEFVFQVNLLKEGEIISQNFYEISVFPSSYKEGPKIKGKIILYDPNGVTKQVLNKAGLSFEEITDFKKLKGDILIIGSQVERGPVEKNKEVILNFVKKGGRVLIFPQRCALDLVPLKLSVGTFRFNTAFPRFTPTHPLMQGLKEDDFKFWRGDPNLVTIYPIHKPEYMGNYKALIQAGPCLDFSSLLEFYYEKGSILYCQLELEERCGLDPVVTIFFRNLVEHIDTERDSFREVSYYDEFGILKDILIDARKLKDLEKIEGDVLILGPNIEFKNIKDCLNKLKEWVKRGGILFIMHQGKEFDFTWLPGEVQIEELNMSPTNGMHELYIFEDRNSKLVEGVSLFDLSPHCYERPKWWKGYDGGMWAFSTKIFAKDPFIKFEGWKVLFGDPEEWVWGQRSKTYPDKAFLVEKELGKGKIVLSQLPFEELLSDVKKAKYSFSSLLTNLGIRLQFLSFEQLAKDIIALDGSWLFEIDPENKGDEKGWSKAEFKDEKWGVMNVPAGWETGIPLPDYDGYGWYRMHVKIPKEWQSKKVKLRVGVIDDCDWTYFNGHFVGGVRFLDAADKPGEHILETPTGKKILPGGPYAVQREYEVLGEYINFGGENVIAVKVYDEKGLGGICSGIVEIRAEEK